MPHPNRPVVPVGNKTLDASGKLYQEYVEDSGVKWTCCTHHDGIVHWRRHPTKYVIDIAATRLLPVERLLEREGIEYRAEAGYTLARVWLAVPLDAAALERLLREAVGASAWLDIRVDNEEVI